MEEAERTAAAEARALNGWLPVWSPVAIVIAGILSVMYFADIFIRSSHKLYWYDELFTVYLSALPTFKATWVAVLHGADFNPPLFYFLTRVSQSLFGHGLIATRLPGTIGIWIFCLCLFIFVSRRVGVVAGAVAGLFPFFTLAQYYAYEARPHGLAVGLCGLALICWQNSGAGRVKLLWSGALAISLVAAALSHVFAIYLLVPFGLVELYSLYKTRTPNWANVCAVVLTPFVVIPVFAPMFKAYRALFGTIGGLGGKGPINIAQLFLINVFGPALAIFFLLIVCSAAHRLSTEVASEKIPSIPKREVALAIAFCVLPLFGIIGVKLTHGVFFDRYFLSSIAGWAILLGFAVSGRQFHSWLPGALAAAMSLMLVADLSMAIYHATRHNSFMLVEPSSGFLFSPDARQPMLRHASLIDPPAGEDIFLLRETDYLFLLYYAAPDVAARIYDSDLILPFDLTAKAYRSLAMWTHQNFKTSTLEPFLKSHDRFLVYGSRDGTPTPCGDCVTQIQQAGFVLKSEVYDDDGILYAYERSQPMQANNQR